MVYNKRKKKCMQTALYDKIKERIETVGKWLIGANTKHTLPFNCNNTMQDKTKARKASIDEG